MQKKNIRYITTIVSILLFIILTANFTVEGWNWGFFDFVFAGVIFFAAGLTIDFVLRKFKSTTSKVLAVIAILIVFIMVWTELAVDTVSQFVKIIFS